MAIVEAHFAVLSKACKFMFAVLRDRMPLAAMSFASKVSSDLVLLARQRTAMFVCEEWVISWWRCPYKMVARYFKGSGPWLRAERVLKPWMNNAWIFIKPNNIAPARNEKGNHRHRGVD
jgi:hypothetical protein